MKKTLSLAASAIALTGCMTAYQPDGLTGGYSETQVAENVWKVSFKGNGYTRRERAEDMALLRSAELTLQQGYSYFAFADSNSRVETMGGMVTPVTTTTTGNAYRSGNMVSGSATSVSSGGQMMFISKPSANNTVVMFKTKPENAGMVYDAKFVCNSLGKKYEVNCIPTSGGDAKAKEQPKAQ